MNHEHLNIDNIIAEIDAQLARPPVSVEDALQEAVIAGRMTISEATECLEAYQHSYIVERSLHPEE